MTPKERALFHLRQAHRRATDGANIIVSTMADFDEEYPASNEIGFDNAAQALEHAARMLRDEIAVSRENRENEK